MLNWRDAAAANRAKEAIEVARAVGESSIEAHAASTLALTLASLGDEPEAIRMMDASATLTELRADDDNVWRLWVNRVYLLYSLGHAEDAAAAAGQAAMRCVCTVWPAVRTCTSPPTRRWHGLLG